MMEKKHENQARRYWRSGLSVGVFFERTRAFDQDQRSMGLESGETKSETQGRRTDRDSGHRDSGVHTAEDSLEQQFLWPDSPTFTWGAQSRLALLAGICESICCIITYL